MGNETQQDGEAGRVLWVEDEPETIESGSSALEKVGLRVDVHEPPVEVNDLISEAMTKGDPYRAVILDLKYPAGQPNGEEVAREIMGVFPKLPVAVVTAHLGEFEFALSRLAVRHIADKNKLSGNRQAWEAWALEILNIQGQDAVRILSYALMDADAARHLFGLLSEEQRANAWSLAETLQVAWRCMLSRHENAPVTTAFLWGKSGQLNTACTGTVHTFPESTKVARLLSEKCVDLADGVHYAFTVNLEGNVETVGAIGREQSFDEHYIAASRCLNHCRATAEAEVLSMLVCGTHKRVTIFAGGRLVLESLHGEWRVRDLETFRDQAAGSARQLGIHWNIASRLCTAAWELSEQQKGCIFLVGEETELLAKCDALPAVVANSILPKKPVDEIPLPALLAMARRDGAVLIDVNGSILSYGAFLRPSPDTKVEIRSGVGARHTSAAKITKEIPALAIVVSEDALATLYHKGKETVA